MNTKQSTAVKAPPTKRQIATFIAGAGIFVSVSYSGNDNTFYIRGIDAIKAELAVLKAFPGMPFKTQSNVNPPIRDAKDYYFRANGDMVNNLASNIVFECKARTARNARRKFGNYISSLTGTAIEATNPNGKKRYSNRYDAKNPAEVAEKLDL